MATNETVNDLFDKAIELEKAAESLYQRLAGMFSAEADVAKFWLGIAAEERGHASYLERVRDKLPLNVLSTPADANILELARKALTYSAAGPLNSVKNLDDAYQLTLELESSETNAVFDFMLANFPSDELAKSQAFLRIQLKKHASDIQEGFPSRFRSKLVRLGIQAQSGG